MLKPAVATLVALVATTAYAGDQVIEAPSDVPPAQVAPAPTGRPVYVAPLSQTTQTTFVPQSVALSGPEEIKDFDMSRPIPDGYTMVQRKRKGLIIGGSVTLGVSYFICALVAAEGEDSASWDGGQNEAGAMWIPVAGPFIQMANEDSATGKLMLAGLGGAQLAGAIMLYYGMTSKKPVLVRNDIVGNLRITPYAGKDSTGLVVGGRF